MQAFDKLVSPLIRRHQVQGQGSSGSRTCFSQPVQVQVCVASAGMQSRLLVESGCDGGCWGGDVVDGGGLTG